MPAQAYGEPLPPMPFLRFHHPDAKTNERMRATFYEQVLSRGVLLHPRHLWFVSNAHRDVDIAHTLEVCNEAMAATRAAHPDALIG